MPQPNRSFFARFLKAEASGGVVLMLCAALALVVANSPLEPAYTHALHGHLGPLSVLDWINDALMSLFFLLVGLEIKREMLVGQLARPADRVLPLIAALGGMVVPALIYLAIIHGEPRMMRGWAIPASTDIAFAIGVMALLGRKAPPSLRMLLAGIAIIDDMGAVAIIALAYTAQIHALPLAVAGLVLIAMAVVNRSGVAKLWPYLVLAALLWVAVLLSGVHATLAGVLAACFIPLRRQGARPSPLHRLEHGLHPWVSFAIVPLFGFANAGVALGGMGLAQWLDPLPLGIAAGLFLGKQMGVMGALWLCAKLKIGARPRGASWRQTYGTALLCGIGFTMSLFIGGLAFADPALVDAVKIGVLGGSLLSALAGALVLAI
ncbi:Na+/H+ antiporter NhaA [Novosphingobium terrae]|uniref:Na+/H+ antiporter NhaA n=1 Tax=Novosphingobium terrae TaxID=2726189 RepID=UPI00198023A6|nr:Na+/H+ antiporter NhaA [Novosphingobium terrae]